MDTYSVLREFADSWFLIAMFGFFLTVVARALWPSHRAVQAEAAAIPMDDEHPRSADASQAREQDLEVSHD